MKTAVLLLCMVLFSTQAFAGGSAEEIDEPVELRFLFPVQVAGPQAERMQEIVNDFNAEHEQIEVEAIYSGNYDQTVQRAITSARGGNPPAVAVATSISLLEFLDMGLIEDLDQFMVGDDAGYADEFYQGFMENSYYDGRTWSIPFQRSLPLLYWNKEHFEAAGLDPETPPRTWDDVIEFSDALRDAPSEYSFTDITEDTWTIQALILQAGGEYSNDEGTEAYFDTPEVNSAFTFWDTLANDMGVMPRQRFYGDAAQDFVTGTTSMMINSSGSFSSVADGAAFEFGVGTLPGDVEDAYPTGGGNLYMFQGLSERERDAAWEFIKYIASPEISAKWTVETGYIPAHPATYETAAMQEHIESYPHFADIADDLENARKEMAFYSNSEIRETLRATIALVLTGQVGIEEGLADLQAEVDSILEPYQN